MTTVGDMMYHMGGVPVSGELTTGDIYFVDSGTGSNSNDGTDKDHPVADIDYAIGLCTANNGDIIYVFPGHAETADTQITCDVAGVKIVGLGWGRSRPAITANASAVDCFNVSAANVALINLRVIGATSCTALINLGAADFYGYKLQLEHGAAPLVAVTVVAAGDRFHFNDCRWLGTANGPDVAIDLEASGAGDDFIVENCKFMYGIYGLDLSAIRANADTVEGGVIHNNLFVGMETTAIDFNSSSQANCAGIISQNYIVTAAAVANVDTTIDAGSYGPVQNYATDVATEGGGGAPATTAA